MEEKKKNRKKRITFFKVFLVLSVIAGAITFAFVSPVFNIETITVQGNEKVDAETIINLSGIQKGSNIFRSVKSNVRENLKENSYIENVKVERKLPIEYLREPPSCTPLQREIFRNHIHRMNI